MSTVEPGRRVALLARPGAARDCVRAALLEVGVELVAEEDPSQADPQAIRGAAPQVLMIVLDAASEDALGRFDVVIGDPAIEVMFEEADVAVSREGWEAARWRRHLAAKLHLSRDVLPPVAVVDAVEADPLSTRLEELIAADADGSQADAEVSLPADVAGGQDFSVFDPVAAEGDDDAGLSLSVEGLDFDPAQFDGAVYEASGFDASTFDASTFDAASFDAASFDAPASDVPDGQDDSIAPVTGPDFSASDFDPLLAELDAELPDRAHPAGVAGWDASAIAFEAPSPEPAAVPVPPPLPRASFGELSLADDSAPVASTPPAAGSHDLQDLERRISSLQLVDDVAPVEGVVLVMAGMGGPDAVRQFLGALPAGFPRAVLVRQRLDGARYDKLVAQMQRATSLPVALAEAGHTVAAGTVYVVGDDLGLDATGGLRFAAGDRLLESLPLPGSAVVLLSGSDLAAVDAVAALAARGAWLGAQASDGCYDPAAAQALAARGAASDAPAELARQLARRWGS